MVRLPVWISDVLLVIKNFLARRVLQHVVQDPDAAVAARCRVAPQQLLATFQLVAELLGGGVLALVEVLHDPVSVLLVRVLILCIRMLLEG